jgi:hypothetical protein
MSIAGPDEGREFNADDVGRFLNSAFGTPVAKDGSGTPTSWDVSNVKVMVNKDLDVVDIYGLDPDQLVYPPDEKSRPSYFYSLFLLKANIGWYGVLAEGRKSLNCRIPLADFEALCG